MGNSLELVFEGSGDCSPGQAKALAERYLGALRTRLPEKISMLLTTEEFLTLTTPPFPPLVITAVSPWQEDRSRVARAVREARNELLANADESLRRCYDYLQEAIEEQRKREGQPAYAVFKAMEVLRERFRNDGKAGIVLGPTFEQAKQAADAERHIPKKNRPRPKGQPVQLARETIRAYERYLLNPPS